MTTFWLAFADPDATADKRFLGVAIFDMDESKRKISNAEVVIESWRRAEERTQIED